MNLRELFSPKKIVLETGGGERVLLPRINLAEALLMSRDIHPGARLLDVMIQALNPRPEIRENSRPLCRTLGRISLAAWRGELPVIPAATPELRKEANSVTLGETIEATRGTEWWG